MLACIIVEEKDKDASILSLEMGVGIIALDQCRHLMSHMIQNSQVKFLQKN